MMRFTIALLMFCSLLPATVQGQVSYNDVAVIVNMNSSASQAIGAYFKTQRNIPGINMVYVSVDTTEEIDSTKFNTLRSQIETYLVANNLQNSINYLVTTKGVPLKVNRGNTFSTTSPSSSVESELMLILGQYSSSIGKSGMIFNPYFYQTVAFSRAAYDIYLVTRLDAYTVQDVKNLIDRSGPNRAVDPTASILLDQDPTWSSPLNSYLAHARTVLMGQGRTVIFDSLATFLTNKQNLLGYMSWGSNDRNQHLYTVNAIPYNTYVPGAIAETYVSTSARTFDTPPVYGQSLIVDLLNEGMSGAKGYVYEPYSSAMAYAYMLFDRYATNYNLAESFYISSRFASWMDVIVGDPKTSVTFSSTGPLPVQLASFTASVVQQGQSIEFTWRTVSETNNYGFYLQRAETGSAIYNDVLNSFVAGHGTTFIPQSYAWTHVQAPAGTAKYRLKQVDLDGTTHYSEPITVTNGVATSVEQSTTPANFGLRQNYPNPFNPSTVIEFSIPQSEPAKLEVYNSVGQLVETLFDGVAEGGQSQKVSFDAKSLASGVYFYRLQSGSKNELKKMTLLK